MNFFDNLSIPASGERFETLYENKGILIEKIISSDKQEKKIYKQDHDEWVMLIEGTALIEIEGKEINMKKGDFRMIEKGKTHQVLKTENGTIWFCIHMG